MHGLRAENHAKTTSAEGPSSIRIARGTPFWTRNRRADWKVASRFVNMGRLLPLGAYPSGAYMGIPVTLPNLRQIIITSPGLARRKWAGDCLLARS